MGRDCRRALLISLAMKFERTGVSMSDVGNLAQCMVECDRESMRRARRVRRKALAVSLCLEAIGLGAMLIWPMVTPGVLPRWYIVTPLPPYHGGGASATRQPQEMHGATRRSLLAAFYSFHPQRPWHAPRQVVDESAPDVGMNPGGGSGVL